MFIKIKFIFGFDIKRKFRHFILVFIFFVIYFFI